MSVRHPDECPRPEPLATGCGFGRGVVGGIACRILRLSVLALGTGAADALAVDGPNFATEVQPILEASCVRCHGAGKDKGGLRIHTREDLLKGGDSGPAIVPGDADSSELVARIRLPHDDDDVMPQEADPLPQPAIAIIERWVADGAPWPEGVRLKPAKAGADNDASTIEALLPHTPPSDTAATAAEIDRILAAGNRASASERPRAAAPVDDLAFLRRATIDVIGRIPTIDEIEAFESAPSGARRAGLVDRLLEHPRFNDRWSVFFADMLRVRSTAPGGDRLLAWLHRSLDARMPYDAMVREMIAASGRPSSNPAVGFILADDADPMALAGATSQIFLGVRLACAECHDHPFDDWTQREFYELAAFFGKTRKVENQFARSTIATEAAESNVLWPPEAEKPPAREPVDPLFPFRLPGTPDADAARQPEFVARLIARRGKPAGADAGRPPDDAPAPSIDDLLDGSIPAEPLGRGDPGEGPRELLTEARRESAALHVENDAHRTSELRRRLADLVTDPRNRFFARSFVNRVWFELVGRGFVEPVDNFTDYTEPAHPAVLEFLAREFVASGYDLRHLVSSIVRTEAYARGHGDPSLTPVQRDAAERAFAVAPVRRMLGEVLFDSILVAGHLFDKKWPDGANVRTVTRQVRIPIPDEPPVATPAEAPATSAPSGPPMARNDGPRPPAAGYDLERGIEVDFTRSLSDSATTMEEIESMRRQAEQRMAREEEMRRLQAATPLRYRIETIEEEVDDNPVFASTMRMATPAPPAHFLRVFGQPGREGLGEFRDHSPSLRQQLMMLNGKAVHEAARVGSLEPIHELLAGPQADPDAAIRHAYLEILTRPPTRPELAEARAVLVDAPSPLDGMADLRWALLNCNEFRYLP